MDEIIRMITADGSVKAMAIAGKDLVERARQIHKLWPVATAALGRTLMAASMMGAALKEERGSVTLQIKGGGPLGTITAAADSGGNVRGYLQNGEVDLPLKGPAKLDVGSAVGCDGSLTVIKDIGLKEPYIGTVQLMSGEIADDLAAYFTESEQIPTACALGVLVDRDQSVSLAGGYLVQLLPGADESVIGRLEESILKLGPITAAMQGGLDAEGLLKQVLAGMGPRLLDRAPVEYRCSCTRERVSRALISMGRAELTKLVEEQGRAELTCQFCDAVYDFDKAELAVLLTEATR